MRGEEAGGAGLRRMDATNTAQRRRNKMAKTDWKTGDMLTATDFNHIGEEINGCQQAADAAIPAVGGATEGDIATFSASGTLADSGVKMSSFTRARMTLSGTTLTITTV